MNASTPLDKVPPGCVVCQHVGGDHSTAVRLKRMGICSGRHIHVVQTGDPMVLLVVGARIGISRQLATHVFVTPVDDNGDRPAQASTAEVTES